LKPKYWKSRRSGCPMSLVTSWATPCAGFVSPPCGGFVLILPLSTLLWVIPFATTAAATGSPISTRYCCFRTAPATPFPFVCRRIVMKANQTDHVQRTALVLDVDQRPSRPFTSPKKSGAVLLPVPSPAFLGTENRIAATPTTTTSAHSSAQFQDGVCQNQTWDVATSTWRSSHRRSQESSLPGPLRRTEDAPTVDRDDGARHPLRMRVDKGADPPRDLLRSADAAQRREASQLRDPRLRIGRRPVERRIDRPRADRVHPDPVRRKLGCELLRQVLERRLQQGVERLARPVHDRRGRTDVDHRRRGRPPQRGQRGLHEQDRRPEVDRPERVE